MHTRRSRAALQVRKPFHTWPPTRRRCRGSEAYASARAAATNEHGTEHGTWASGASATMARGSRLAALGMEAGRVRGFSDLRNASKMRPARIAMGTMMLSIISTTRGFVTAGASAGLMASASRLQLRGGAGAGARSMTSALRSPIGTIAESTGLPHCRRPFAPQAPRRVTACLLRSPENPALIKVLSYDYVPDILEKRGPHRGKRQLPRNCVQSFACYIARSIRYFDTPKSVVRVLE